MAFAAMAASPKAADAKPQAAQSDKVNIQADQQNFNPTNNQAVFQGNVLVSYKNLMIRGPKAFISLDESGSPDIATFFKRPMATRSDFQRDDAGKPTAIKSNDTLQADTIRFHLKENQLHAEGTAVSNITTLASNPIVVRSEQQHFDNQTKVVTASGGVRVDYKDTQVQSGQATLKVGTNGKAERVVFTNNVHVNKPDGTIQAQKLTIMVNSENMIAEQNVNTVVQSKGKPPVHIQSDFQQYDKNNDTFLASGRVRLKYEDYTATGTKATFKLKNGSVDNILLTGRPQITTNGRTIIADTLTITTNPKNFNALGHVKTQLDAKQLDTDATPEASPSAAGNSKKPSATSAKASGSKASGKTADLPLKPKPSINDPKPFDEDY